MGWKVRSDTGCLEVDPTTRRGSCRFPAWDMLEVSGWTDTGSHRKTVERESTEWFRRVLGTDCLVVAPTTRSGNSRFQRWNTLEVSV